MSNFTLPAQAAGATHVLNLGTVAAGKSITVSITSPEEAVTGRAADTRQFRVLMKDGNGNAFVVGQLRLNQGTDLPVNIAVAVPMLPTAQPNSWTAKLVSEPVGSGLAHPELGIVVVNYEE